MKESFWGIFVVMMGLICIFFIYFFQNMTNTDEHNYNILKETTEAAMYDAVSLSEYRNTGVVRMDREKFVENFLRRFAENASLSRTYVISIYDINEEPPKVSLKVSSTASSVSPTGGEILNFDIANKVDAILEEK